MIFDNFSDIFKKPTVRAKSIQLNGNLRSGNAKPTGILKGNNALDQNSYQYFSGNHDDGTSTNYPRSTDASSQHRLSEQIYNNAVQDVRTNLVNLESSRGQFSDEKYNEVISKLERMEQILYNLESKNPSEVQRRESISNDLRTRLDVLNTQKELGGEVLKLNVKIQKKIGVKRKKIKRE